MQFARLSRGLTTLRHQSTSAAAASTSSTPAPPPPASSSALAQSSAPSASTSSAPSPRSPPSSTPKSVANQYMPPGPFAAFTPIPPKHNLHVATLHLRSHTTSLPALTFFTQFALRAARALGLSTTGAVALPTKTSLYTVPRSPFAHKKSQQNFWRKEHKRAIKVFDGNPEVVGAWLAYLRREAMGGVGQKAQVFEYKQLGWGKDMVSEESLRQTGMVADDAQVEALANDLIAEMKAEVEAGGAEPAAEVNAPREAEEIKPAEVETEKEKKE